jgi:competence protein ComEC
LLPLFGMAAGILATRLASFRTGESVAAMAVFAILALPGTRVRLVCVFLAAAFFGVWTSVVHRPGLSPRLNAESGETLVLAGCVVEPPSMSDDREQFLLELAPDARARVTVHGGVLPPLQYGQRVEALAKVRYPRNFGNPGAFDYVGWLARRNVYWSASGRAGDIKVMPGSCGSRLQAWIYQLRTGALDRLDRLYPTDSYKSGMLKALLIGDTTHIEKVWTEHFRRTGTYHALVISGIHITVVAGTILLFRGLLPSYLLLPLAGVVAWMYAVVAGAEAPVMRSAAGFTLFLVARWFYRRGRLLNILAFTGLVFLAADPEQIFDASFQLTFLSVLAIGVIAVPTIEKTSAVAMRAARGLEDVGRDVHFDRVAGAVRVELRLLAETLALANRARQRLACRCVSIGVRLGAFAFDSMLTSASIQLGLVLPMVYYFHRISITGLTANIVVVLALNLAVQIGFLAIFTGLRPAAWAAGALLEFARSVVDWHARWEPGFRVPDPPAWMALVVVLGLLAAFRWRRLGLAVTLTGLIAIAFWPGAEERGVLELSAVDVGQGDSLFLTLPDGKRMIVDGGGIPFFKGQRPPKMDIGEDVVSPYLWSRRIRSVDVLVLTHGHDDHAAGLPALAANFHPREIWVGAGPIPAALVNLHLPLRRLEAGAPFPFGGAEMQVLAPVRDYQAGDSPKNNDSLVLLLHYGEHRFLLTGDAEKQIEWHLLDSGEVPKIDVLKVAHHGSRTSSTQEFLDAARPRVALISVGADNFYGLPNRDVVERYRAANMTVLRTDELGLSTVRSDGRHLSFEVRQWQDAGALRYEPF